MEHKSTGTIEWFDVWHGFVFVGNAKYPERKA